MARAGTMPFHREFFGDYQDLGLQAKNDQLRVAVLILAYLARHALPRHARGECSTCELTVRQTKHHGELSIEEAHSDVGCGRICISTLHVE